MSPSSTNRGSRFPPEVYERAEVDALIAACSARAPTGIRNRALIALLYRAGLRVAEALALRPGDVDPKSGLLYVRHGKGDRDRRAQLGVRRSAPLLCTLRGAALSQGYVRTLLPRLGRAAGVQKRVHPHGFRHTYASELARDGFELREIQALLGHTRASTTERYLARIAPERLAERIRGRPAWDVEGIT